MYFESCYIYHIYNQGNNRQRIFFNRDNYVFFLNKIQKHVLPFSDILAWCLMPNHFHLMVYVNNLKVEEQLVLSPGATSSRARTIALNENPHNKYDPRLISFNKSIGIMLASYTRAINNQILSSGSLFRQETKAINISKPESVTSAWFNSLGLTYINAQNPERQYPNICFNYINKNPVKDGLVQKPEDWEFSSFLDITGRRNGKLINRNRIKEYGLVLL